MKPSRRAPLPVRILIRLTLAAAVIAAVAFGPALLEHLGPLPVLIVASGLLIIALAPHRQGKRS